MTTKKKAQGGAKGKTRGQLKARAEAIIKDVRGFDGDTRRALQWALDRLADARGGATAFGSVAARERDLRELLDKAERGLYVFDVDDIGAGYVEAAQLVYDLIAHPDAPPFISDNLQATVYEAANRFGGEPWISPHDDDAAEGDFSVAIMARTFKHHSNGTFDMAPKLDLAGLISAVLTHDDVPQVVYDKLTDALCEMNDSTDVYGDPQAVRALLDYHAQKDGDEKGGA